MERGCSRRRASWQQDIYDHFVSLEICWLNLSEMLLGIRCVCMYMSLYIVLWIKKIKFSSNRVLCQCFWWCGKKLIMNRKTVSSRWNHAYIVSNTFASCMYGLYMKQKQCNSACMYYFIHQLNTKYYISMWHSWNIYIKPSKREWPHIHDWSMQVHIWYMSTNVWFDFRDHAKSEAPYVKQESTCTALIPFWRDEWCCPVPVAGKTRVVVV